MRIKRIVSLFLTFVIALSMMPMQAFAEEETPEAQVDAGDVTIEGTNGFGSLLSEAISEEQSEMESKEDAAYTVTDLEIQGNIATVTYDSMEEAVLIVALYTEDGMQLLTSGKTTVIPENTVATVAFEGTMPEYFLASAYLVDIYDLSPLCPAYDTPMYTQEMQELMASTVHDYDQEKILNLDNDETTNFAVYAETTKIIEYVEGYNIVASADEENNTYVIENADEQILSLQQGDILAYSYGESDILIAKVVSIIVEGNTVVIQGGELEIEEVFDYVKIAGEGNDDNFTLDDSTALEGVVYQANPDSVLPNAVHSSAVETTEIDSGTASTSIGVSFEAVKLGGSNANVKLTGGGTLSLSFGVEFYITLSYQRVEIRAEVSFKGTAGISGTVKASVKLGNFGFDIIPSVLHLGTSLNFVIKAEGKVEASITMGLKVGLIVDHGKQGWSIDGYCAPQVKVETKFEGGLYYGFELEPNAKILYGALADVKLTVEAGEEYSLETELHHEVSDDERHLCGKCYSGDIKQVLTLEGSAKFLKMKKLSIKRKIVELSKKTSDIYYTEGLPCFQYGKCPNLAYKLTVTVVDADGNAVNGAAIAAGEYKGTTDKNGVAEIFLPVAEYVVTVNYGESTQEYAVYMDRAQKVKVNIHSDESRQMIGGVLGTVEVETVTDHGSVVASGNCGALGDNITWTLYSSGLLRIAGVGDMMDYSRVGIVPWYKNRNSVKTVVIEDEVTSIGKYAFSQCTSLSNISIPMGVTSIGYRAFAGCISLKRIEIPESVSSIGQYAFYECEGLVYVEMPNYLDSLGMGAFCGCTSLICLTIPYGVSEIDQATFKNCTSLAEVVIPKSISTIRSDVFANCTSLTHISIPASVTYISDEAFSSCTSLQGICVDNDNPNYSSDSYGVLFDKEKARLIQAPGGMYGHYDIPASVLSVREDAFLNCRNLVSVNIPDSVTSIGSNAFKYCTELLTVHIGSGITELESHIFSYCAKLDNVVIPESVTTIGFCAFDSCKNLKSVTIPESVTTIEESAFYYCYGLTSITIPASVARISGSAFFECKNLNKVMFNGNAPIFGSHVFYGATATAYYPADDTTWTSDVMQSYGGKLTWIPYTLDENGNMIINEATAVTMSTEVTENETPDGSNGEIAEENDMTITGKETVMQTDLDVPVSDFEHRDEPVDPNAVIGGDYGTEIVDTYTLKTASFAGLVPGQEYVLLALKSIEVEDPLSANNMLFIDQADALEDGTLKFTYVQRENTNLSYVMACGASNENLKDAEITFPEMTANGELQVVDPTVVYESETLEEGRDYVIVGTVSFTEAGEYTCYVRGVRKYTGLVECVYQVQENPDAVPVSSISISPDNSTINIGSTLELKASVSPANATNPNVSWSSSNLAVASVSNEGVVTAKGKGTVTIIATAKDGSGITGECTITVTCSHSSDHIIDPAVPATCTQKGLTEGKRCSACNEVIVEQTEVPPLGHSWNGNSCDRCGETRGGSFIDVPEGKYYYDAVQWAVEKGITAGVDATHFGPDQSCTRAHVVSFLWRAAGSPEPASSSSPFTDVAAGSFYYKAVLWAVEQGITAGTSDTTFSPNAECTRGQVVAFLWRAKGKPASGGTNGFTDVSSDSYCYDAVLWAVANGITAGTSATTFAPNAECTRGQVVAFLYRTYNN